jgi:hypothetical protein
VVTYSSDYEGELPPAATKVARPTILARFKSVGDTAVGYYLFEYLPGVEIFNCSLTGFDKNFLYSSIPVLGGLPYTYQEIYQDPDLLQYASIPQQFMRQNCSYALLWNFESFNKSDATIQAYNKGITSLTGNMYGKPFIGPGRKSKNQLAICDSFYYSGNLSASSYWISNHPFKNADKYKDWEFSYYLRGGLSADFLSDDDLNTIPLNAGYIDGHVDRYYSMNSIQQLATLGYAEIFLPEKWK